MAIRRAVVVAKSTTLANVLSFVVRRSSFVVCLSLVVVSVVVLLTQSAFGVWDVRAAGKSRISC